MKLNEFIGGIRTFFNFNRSPHLEISSPQLTYNYQPPSNIIFLCQHHVEKVNPNSKTFDPLLLSKSFSQDLETINIPLEILFVYQVLLKTVKPFLKEGSQDECMELKDTLIQTSINNLFLGEREKLIELLSQKNLLHIASLLLNNLSSA